MKNPRVKAIGKDGNIFVILGKAQKALRKAGLGGQIEKMATEVEASGNYSEALSVIRKYVELY